MKEITFTSLKNDFDAICDEVNQDKEAVTLTLKSNRKVYIMPEESYDNIERFVITTLSPKTLSSRM
ncbi:MAG: type II toxin-antitoxin system Phd/YefM family antitoxin [Lachnospiraceae bacterium]|nr:type II toxin-antitoxin system Phd/YefM family antitoxin [Lachnospiraceae bacterium]